MIVSYTFVGGTGWTTLFDESAGASFLEDWTPDMTAKVQEEDLAGSQSKFRYPLGNIACKFSWKINAAYTTKANALESMATFGALLNTMFHIQVIQDSATVYFPNASATGYKPTQKGVSVDHILQISCDGITLTSPV